MCTLISSSVKGTGDVSARAFSLAAHDPRDSRRVRQAATLTLLGLIIGFTFSMALNRYDQRKNFGEEEASAIGTAYIRAALLPPDDAAKVRTLLASYLHQRILLYQLSRADPGTP
ncbi:MAG: hypothetical protein JO371_00300 [Paraburkholderia sp.]|nr:hypothetical protein [Paraburkholderia sp.]